jgi:hypothetical protein
MYKSYEERRYIITMRTWLILVFRLHVASVMRLFRRCDMRCSYTRDKCAVT